MRRPCIAITDKTANQHQTRSKEIDVKRRVRIAGRLFQRSRLARTLFVIAVWPPAYIADRLRGHEPPSWRRGMEWARNGEVVHPPTIPTSDTPAVVRRRPDTRCPGRVVAYADGRTGRCVKGPAGHPGECA